MFEKANQRGEEFTASQEDIGITTPDQCHYRHQRIFYPDTAVNMKMSYGIGEIVPKRSNEFERTETSELYYPTVAIPDYEKELDHLVTWSNQSKKYNVRNFSTFRKYIICTLLTFCAFQVYVKGALVHFENSTKLTHIFPEHR